ncbi:hypothetical protein STVA_28990 [Allostella vacuolata]|nr:hypothetical protein STVA_28990 [Stella vacuolata]
MVRQLRVPGKPPGSQPPARPRILVPVNDNRPPLPVRLRRPVMLAGLTALAVIAAFHWLV